MQTRSRSVMPLRMSWLISFALVSLPPSDVFAAIRWRGDFSTGNLDQWYSFQCGASASTDCPSNKGAPRGRLQLVTPPGLTSGTTLRVELRDGDLADLGERNELVGAREDQASCGSRKLTTYTEGDERYFAWSTFFPSDFPAPPPGERAWHVFFQFHHEANCRSPPLELTLNPSGGDYQIQLWSAQSYKDDGAALWTTPIARGTWHDFVLRVRFSTRSDAGIIELWHNGTQVLSATRRATLFTWTETGSCNPEGKTGAQRNYLKLGLYRAPDLTSTEVVYHRDMRVGDDYQDVVTPAPRAPPMSSLQDPFNDGAIDSELWTLAAQSAGTVSEDTGLELAPSANNGSTGLWLSSNNSYSLSNSYVYVKAPEVISPEGFVEEEFFVRLDSNNRVVFHVQNGKLWGIKVVGGAMSAVFEVAYSASGHRWWRFREAAGTLYWETSEDGGRWTQLGAVSVRDLFSMDALTVNFSVDTWGGGLASPGRARFNALNTTSNLGAGERCWRI